MSVNEGLSTCGALIPCQHLECCGLARTIDAQQPKAFPGTHTHTQPVHSQDAPNLAGLVHLVGKGKADSAHQDPLPHPHPWAGVVPGISLQPDAAPTFVRFSIFSMSLSASPRRTRCLSLATSMSSSMGLVETGRRLWETAEAGGNVGPGAATGLGSSHSTPPEGQPEAQVSQWQTFTPRPAPAHTH